MPSRCLRYLSLGLAWALASPLAHALLQFNDGKDQIFVSSTYAFGYDTNVFAQKVQRGSITQNWSFEADYTRHAGIIWVNAVATMNLGAFAGIAGQDFADPGFSLGFNKGTGRTTGGIDLKAQKVNAPDPVANNRAIGWNYSGALNLRYPINERLFLTNVSTVGGTAYANKLLFTDLNDYSDAFDVNIVYDSKLTFDTGYNFATDQTHDVSAYDHSFFVGASGTLAPKLTGSVDLGYTLNQTDYSHPHAKTEYFDSYYAAANLAWRFSRNISFSGQASKTLGISSTDITDDTTDLGVGMDSSLGKKFQLHLGVDYIPTVYLGRRSQNRKDYLWEFLVSLRTALTTHINVALNYAYMINYSNLSSARFERQTISGSINAKY